MLAALFYFVLTMKTVAPKYRTSSVLSVVVMVSAFLILYFQAESWMNAFVFDDMMQAYVPVGDSLFSNGYRYLNWLIDVPMLLFQLLFIVGIAGVRRTKLRNWFFFSGAMMIITGYFGQFYEVTNDGSPGIWMGIWGIVSTVFFLHILYLIFRILKDAIQQKDIPTDAKKYLKGIWWLFLFSWMLYPLAYVMPALFPSADGMVARQLLFTTADILAKVIYGIMLVQIATIRSREEGYTLPA